MNWKLIFQLSLLGLLMGVGSVFFIPAMLEPFLWLVIFLLSAYFIATRAANRYFLHGVTLGLANCVWITSAHVIFISRYLPRHPSEAAMMASMPMPTHPRVMMAVFGPVVGLVSGIIIGALAVFAHRMVTPRTRPAVSSS
jgi:hypothetical protein